MDNPAMSLFHGNEINLSNTKQNDDDEEDMEEQRRRNEELQSLVKAKLDDFNFDESTVNSSTNISVLSADEIQNKYSETINPSEQLKILCEVRTRELTNLREEYENYKKEKSREVDNLKNKVFLYEAEIHQIKISLKNSEELLVEKTSYIEELKKSLKTQEETIKECKTTIQNLQIDISTYQSTITELHLKLEAEKNPLFGAKMQFNSEEMRMARQQQIERLESLLEEKNKTTAFMEKENLSLQEQLKKCVDFKNEDNRIINGLTENLESAQNQCKELLDIIEKLTNENHHLRDRINDKYVENNTDDFHNQSNGAIIEKLKRMLLDKSVENETLEAKLRSFESILKEVLEYRDLKTNVYKKEFQQCENMEHTKCLLLMQNDLQNYKRLVDDKNQQILSLNSTNKELLEKLEEKLSQTRLDIQNFSHKYNLPQLEKMTEDLRISQEKIAELEIELKKSEEKRDSLCLKLQKSNQNCNKDLETRYNELKRHSEEERMSFESQLKNVNKELEISAKEISSLKSYIDQLINENTKLKLNLKQYQSSQTESGNEKLNKSNIADQSLKKQYLDAIQKLNEAQFKIKCLEENIEDLSNGKTLAEGEQCNLRYQITDYKNKLEEKNETIKDLKNEMNNLRASLNEQSELIKDLQKNPSVKSYEELQKNFLSNEEELKTLKNRIEELVQQVEKLKVELDQSREVVIRLTKGLAVEAEKNVQKNIEKELNETQLALDKLRKTKGAESDVDIMRIELKLREEIQKDYLQKLKDIEKKYEKSSAFNKDLFNEQSNKLKIQENKFRDQIATILRECAQKIDTLEKDRQNLLKQYNLIQENFNNYKQHVAASEEAYKRIINESQTEIQKQTSQWKNWSKKVVTNCSDIEKVYKENAEKMFHKMDVCNKEVAAVEKTYNDKIKKYVKNCKM